MVTYNKASHLIISPQLFYLKKESSLSTAINSLQITLSKLKITFVFKLKGAYINITNVFEIIFPHFLASTHSLRSNRMEYLSLK